MSEKKSLTVADVKTIIMVGRCIEMSKNYVRPIAEKIDFSYGEQVTASNAPEYCGQEQRLLKAYDAIGGCTPCSAYNPTY